MEATGGRVGLGESSSDFDFGEESLSFSLAELFSELFFVELDVLEKERSNGFGSKSNVVFPALFVVVIVSATSFQTPHSISSSQTKYVQTQPIMRQSLLRRSSAQVDFARIYSSLGLGKETIAAVQAFRKRHAEAQRISNQLASQPTTVDINSYRSRLRNQAVVDEFKTSSKTSNLSLMMYPPR